ncbi:phage major capsid protein, P2 family [Paraburkholderia sp. B3]|uniref:phage major capsid protein, P2 family n=1 Tax=Paraburkholderia sp. B3 TaxID=3134791 RepID=UPI00398219AB
MQNNTRELFNAYLAAIAKLNAIADPSKKFAVSPSVQQTLEKRLQDSSAFLNSINVAPVTEQMGEKLGLGIGGPIAGTTDTKVKDRETIDPTDVDANGYFCYQTNFDSHIPYAKLDMWAKFPNFQTLIRDLVLTRQALDRIMIGFNGVKRSPTSDRTANPLLQDVNKGWLQHYREQAAERVMDHGQTAGKIVVGAAAGSDYKNLDALVYDAKTSLIDPWHRQDTQLVAILGDALMKDKYFPIVNANNAPTEQVAVDLVISQKRVGGLPAVTVPYFPANGVLITRLDNLSLYYQSGARRRTIVENAKRDRIENFESSNDAYVIEDFGAGCLVENIEQAE